MRPHQTVAREAVGYVVRAMSFRAFIPTAAVAVAIATASKLGSEVDVTMLAVVVVLALGAVFDDPASEVLAPSPTPLARRRAQRALPAVAVVGAVWVASASGASLRGGDWPDRWAMAELGVLVAVALAAAALGAGSLRGSDARSGSGLTLTIAGGLVWALGAHHLPGRWAIYPLQTHQPHWLVLATAALLTIALLSRDPAARALRH